MLRGLYTAASGMKLQQTRQENISHNISNLNTTSFKGELMVSKASFNKLIKSKENVYNNTLDNELGNLELGVEIDEKSINFSQGMLEKTNNKLDFALEGRGYFTARLNGETYYTRDGTFKLDNDGRLVTSQGALVLGEDLATGEEKYIVAKDGKITVDENGIVNDSIKILVRDFDDYDLLEKAGDNLFINSGSNIIDGNYSVKQGYLEKSNVDVLEEMVKMIEVSRVFQSNSRVLQSFDDTLDKAVNEIGRIRG